MDTKVGGRFFPPKIKVLSDLNGAPEGNNLEPFSSPELLEELENWTEVLKAEPEVIHRLAAFADAAAPDAEGTDSSPPTAVLPGLEP